MFYRYELKEEDNEQVLYLFIDDKYEFAVFGADKDNLYNKIKKYIKDMKINFNGKKVILVVGGILVTFFLATTADIKDYSTFEPTISVATVEEVVEESDISEVELKEEPIIEDKIEVNTSKDVTKETVPPPVIESVKPVVENKPVAETKPEIKPEEKSEVIVQQPQGVMVTVVRSSGIVEQIELEDYLVGVVGAEMPASFGVEALKAQTVVARTYTLKRMSEGKTLTDTESTQAYKDRGQLQVLWGGSFDTYYNKIKNAVVATKDEYITYNGGYIDAVYHSTSNGYTEDAIYVWGYNIPYLKSVDSHWDLTATPYLKTIQKSDAEILQVMGINITSDTPIEVIERSSSNRINKIQVGGNVYSGIDLYKKLGLRSRDFDFEVVNNMVNITTRGYGHGVGMSQYGANGMAKEGYSYRDIISHYYTNVQIKS